MFAAIASIVAVAAVSLYLLQRLESRLFPRGEVEVKGVAKVYDNGLEALRDVNLSFPKGQLSTLLGPSGCGKTTPQDHRRPDPKSGGEVRQGRSVEGPGPERAFVFHAGFRALGGRAAKRRLRLGAARRGAARARRSGAQVHRRGGPQGLRASLPEPALRRHATTRRPRARAHRGRRHHPHGRAVLVGRRADAAQVPGGPARPPAPSPEDPSSSSPTASRRRPTFDQIALLSPRPGTVSRIVRPDIDRSKSPTRSAATATTSTRSTISGAS